MKKFLQKSKEIFNQIFAPAMLISVLVYIYTGDYHRANYFLILLIGNLLLDRLDRLKDSIYTVAIPLYKRNLKDGIE
ncbi:hypothetical protein G8B49_01945 [Enterococcus mundtii]|uniref:hypothetical protein n=1 Tax=Enterococcus mundtii TaxID=53346 RepID=UPI0018843A21|nr:hypothetical protein [Enterococcus mundtii]MBE9910023.1 hypothetical protein [Enterococcus mundtii]